LWNLPVFILKFTFRAVANTISIGAVDGGGEDEFSDVAFDGPEAAKGGWEQEAAAAEGWRHGRAGTSAGVRAEGCGEELGVLVADSGGTSSVAASAAEAATSKAVASVFKAIAMALIAATIGLCVAMPWNGKITTAGKPQTKPMSLIPPSKAGKQMKVETSSQRSAGSDITFRIRVAAQ
jgi:hypothetical protein